MSTPYVTVDVVDLRRIERLSAEFGPALERRLMHPIELDRLATMDAAAKVRRLGVALGTKEAWIKARSGRPAGWTFDRAAFVPTDEAERPSHVQALVADFVDDLGVTSVEAGIVCEDPSLCDLSDPASAGAHWAWHGMFEHWLISALLG